jgi:hypothetical protein
MWIASLLTALRCCLCGEGQTKGEKAMPITDADLKTLQDKFTKLVADKSDADAKTQASNTADTAAAVTAAAAAQAKLDEAAADGLVNADVADLKSFIDGL